MWLRANQLSSLSVPRSTISSNKSLLYRTPPRRKNSKLATLCPMNNSIPPMTRFPRVHRSQGHLAPGELQQGLSTRTSTSNARCGNLLSSPWTAENHRSNTSWLRPRRIAISRVRSRRNLRSSFTVCLVAMGYRAGGKMSFLLVPNEDDPSLLRVLLCVEEVTTFESPAQTIRESHLLKRIRGDNRGFGLGPI